MSLPLACGRTPLYLSLTQHTHTRIYVHYSKRETLAARKCLETHSDTDTQTYAAGNIDFLFGITKRCATQLRGSGYSLDHGAHKQYSAFLSSHINTSTTFYRQTFADRSSARKKKELILIISLALFHLSQPLLSLVALPYCLSMHLFFFFFNCAFLFLFFFSPPACVFLGVIPHSVECSASLAQC